MSIRKLPLALSCLDNNTTAHSTFTAQRLDIQVSKFKLKSQNTYILYINDFEVQVVWEYFPITFLYSVFNRLIRPERSNVQFPDIFDKVVFLLCMYFSLKVMTNLYFSPYPVVRYKVVVLAVNLSGELMRPLILKAENKHWELFPQNKRKHGECWECFEVGSIYRYSIMSGGH